MKSTLNLPTLIAVLRRCSLLAAAALAATATTFGPSSLISTAEANPPRFGVANCRTGQGAMGLNMGRRNAARLAQQVWARLKTCDQVDRYVQILSELPLQRPAMQKAFAACFYKGYTEEIWAQLDIVYGKCDIACFNAGAEIGAISADGYCAASLAVGGLYDPGFIEQPPLPICGLSLAMGCRSEYINVATSQFPGCRQYTEGYFTETFDNSVRQDCYVPSDVPISPSSSYNELSFLY